MEPFLKNYLLILERQGKEEREENIDFVVQLIYILWWLLICALTSDQTCNLGIWGERSNQVSYQNSYL